MLLGLFLFNGVGYRVLNDYLQDRAARQMEAKLDKFQIQEDQLLYLKVPTTHLSYYNTVTDFERINGRIDIDGVPYQYVARRIVNDSAAYLCIPNLAALDLRAGRDNWFARVNDLRSQQNDPKGAGNNPDPNFLGDPYDLPADHSFGGQPKTPVTHNSLSIPRLSVGEHTPAYRPPAATA